RAVWFILPAFVANAAPVIGYKVFGKYNKPIDFGKKLGGKPILGPGKTWGGLIFGIAFGTLFGFIQSFFQPHSFPVMNLQLAFLLSLGALTGDAFGSFIKRRLGFARGKSLPGLDQLGFLVFALIFAYPVATLSFLQIIFLLIVVPAAHLLMNVVAYLLGLKREWY
ncbi:MAG: CDP-2,3-bis-(O-geranylgeranyl)-sn-glycerol synthase, partial [Candidatus Nanoarchaeia archaeon]